MSLSELTEDALEQLNKNHPKRTSDSKSALYPSAEGRVCPKCSGGGEVCPDKEKMEYPVLCDLCIGRGWVHLLNPADQHDFDKIAIKISHELARAKAKHPHWHSDLMWQIAVISEEMGEVAKAGVEFMDEGGKYEEIEKEVIQLAATCIRLLMTNTK